MDAVPQKPGKLAVSERDVALAVLYDTPYIIVLHHQQIANRSSGTAHVCLYTIYQEYVNYRFKKNPKITDLPEKYIDLKSFLFQHYENQKKSYI